MPIKKCKKCENDRYANTSWCLKHFKEHEKEKAAKKKNKDKPVKSKKVSISVLKKKADKVFSDFIRKRDKGKCFTCGCVKEWKQQQNGHYITRGCIATRYDETNCHCQCVACNIFKCGNYTAYSLKMIEKYGVEKLEELEKIKQDSMVNIKKYGKEFYLDIIKKYE